LSSVTAKTPILIATTLGLVVVVLLFLFLPRDHKQSIPVEMLSKLQDAELIERGEYLALAGNCASCHTTQGGAYMAGGLAFETPFGVIYSTNITPDSKTGIGAWSAEDFLASMRHGVRPDGEHLYPVFPYTSFTKVSDEDVVALYAFLKSIPAVQQDALENDLPFPFGIRALMTGWKALFFTPGAFAPDTSRPDEWNRGAYLVEALAHCSACHTPRNVLGAELSARFLSGGEYVDHVGEGRFRPWSAPNITGSERGLGLWEQEELAHYLKEARNAFLESFGPMNEVIMNSTRHLDTTDIDAMAQYLKTLPWVEEPQAAMPAQQVMGRGRTVYNLHCGTCHLPTGEGDPEMAPRLNAGSLVVQAANPASMINAILYSPQAPHPPLPQKWLKPMEEFQWLLDDEEVAAVASYIRHSWDNAAGTVTPEDVARQR
jgi:mono/diheme cytochrome c family protein